MNLRLLSSCLTFNLYCSTTTLEVTNSCSNSAIFPNGPYWASIYNKPSSMVGPLPFLLIHIFNYPISWLGGEVAPTWSRWQPSQ